MPRFRAFLAELKRRRVWRVAVVYAVTALAVVEAADLFFPRLALPEWSVTLVVVLAVLGFPIALVLAWAFEVSPEGVRRTEPVAGAGPLEPGQRRTLFAAAAGLALLAGGGWWLLAAGGGGSAPTIERLAVLPLSNLMNDPDQEYFVQGMHDRLISELQQAGVAVIARTSVLHYGEPGTPVREIARELGVDAVIEGSVFRAGDSVAIEARLVDGTTEEYLWRESFGGDLRNVVALHRDLSRAIAEEIQAALTPQAEARLASARPVDPQAYEAYLKGRLHLERLSPADLDAALQYFELTLEADPGFALAHAGIARVWGVRETFGLAPVEEAAARVKEAAQRALELDDGLAESHAILAYVRTREWDWEGAEAAFRRAIELNPNDAASHAFYSHHLLRTKRPRLGMEEIELALELDPLNPLYQSLYGVALMIVGRYDDAIARFQEILRLAPGNQLAYNGLSAAYFKKGMLEECLAAKKAFYDALGEREVVEAMERGYAEGGYSAAMERAAETLAARPGYDKLFDIAVLYMLAGDEDRALEWLERAYEARDGDLHFIAVIPTWDSLHDDPRFRDLVRRVGLPL